LWLLYPFEGGCRPPVSDQASPFFLVPARRDPWCRSISPVRRFWSGSRGPPRSVGPAEKSHSQQHHTTLKHKTTYRPQKKTQNGVLLKERDLCLPSETQNHDIGHQDPTCSGTRSCRDRRPPQNSLSTTLLIHDVRSDATVTALDGTARLMGRSRSATGGPTVTARSVVHRLPSYSTARHPLDTTDPKASSIAGLPKHSNANNFKPSRTPTATSRESGRLRGPPRNLTNSCRLSAPNTGQHPPTFSRIVGSSPPGFLQVPSPNFRPCS